MKILCVSLTGTTRSKILADMLKSEIIETKNIGVCDLYSPFTNKEKLIKEINDFNYIFFVDTFTKNKFKEFFINKITSPKRIHTLNIPMIDNENSLLEEFNYKNMIKEQIKNLKLSVVG